MKYLVITPGEALAVAVFKSWFSGFVVVVVVLVFLFFFSLINIPTFNYSRVYGNHPLLFLYYFFLMNDFKSAS